jgi:cell division protein FtsW
LGDWFSEDFWFLDLAILALLKITGGNIIPSFFGSIAYVNKRFIAFANPFQDTGDSDTNSLTVIMRFQMVVGSVVA